MVIDAGDARAQLLSLIRQVNDDHVPVYIRSERGDAVLVSAADFDSWHATAYPLR